MKWSDEAIEMANDAPSTKTWGKFASEKWDHERARNVLLHFIQHADGTLVKEES